MCYFKLTLEEQQSVSGHLYAKYSPQNSVDFFNFLVIAFLFIQYHFQLLSIFTVCLFFAIHFSSVCAVLGRGSRGRMVIHNEGAAADSVGAALFSSFPTQRAGRVAPSSHPSRLNMAGSQLLSVFILLVLCSVRVSGEVVNFADSVQFTVREECAGGGMRLVRVRKTDPIVPRTVATLVHGVWQPAEDYKHRIHHVSASSVKLSELDFNDDAFYEFTCNNDLIRTIQLTVVFPYDVRVCEGETARIPCHLPSEELQGKSAQFERDGELVLVLEQTRSSGQPEGRLSVSPDWVQTGDLSLTVEDAQLEDGGSYVCYTVDGNGGKTRGEPAAVKVTVQRNRPAPTDAPQQVSHLSALLNPRDET